MTVRTPPAEHDELLAALDGPLAAYKAAQETFENQRDLLHLAIADAIDAGVTARRVAERTGWSPQRIGQIITRVYANDELRGVAH